jgi:hypothetical protein
MSGSMCQGSWSMLHTPSTLNMPKTCMAWTQIMSRNANGAFHLGHSALPSGQRMRASPTSERLPSGNWGRLTQHNFSCLIPEHNLQCKLPRAGHKVIRTVRSPHWFRRGRHIKMMCSRTSERFPSGNWGCLTKHNFPLPSGARSYAWDVMNCQITLFVWRELCLPPWTSGFAFCTRD